MPNTNSPITPQVIPITRFIPAGDSRVVRSVTLRNYEKESIALEVALLRAGILNTTTLGLTLTELVNLYAPLYLSCGPLHPQGQSYGQPSLPAAPVIPPPPTVVVVPKNLSVGQEKALVKLKAWLTNAEPFFVLKGYAGTGKTYLMQLLGELSTSIYYSAPTNKAAKVLGVMVGRKAKTTYAMLGLRMEQKEDELVLTASGIAPYFPRGSILVVDEAGMVGTQLSSAIDAARTRCKIKILYVGDPAQLTPIGEAKSPAWATTRTPETRSMLTEVIRFDNQLLTLATKLRVCIKEQNWVTPFTSDHDTKGGVWKWRSGAKFEQSLLSWVDSATDLSDTKVVAWRNKTVDRYNDLIRERLGFKDTYCVGDILLLAKPIEEYGALVAHTDDEFKVLSVEDSVVDVDGKGIKVWALQVTGDQTLTLKVAKDQDDLDLILSRKATAARKADSGTPRRLAWKEFWDIKAKFNTVRYGYALTAHRAQGSTYRVVYVDQMDILANSTKREAFRCLYVAATRASEAVHSY